MTPRHASSAFQKFPGFHHTQRKRRGARPASSSMLGRAQSHRVCHILVLVSGVYAAEGERDRGPMPSVSMEMKRKRNGHAGLAVAKLRSCGSQWHAIAVQAAPCPWPARFHTAGPTYRDLSYPALPVYAGPPAQEHRMTPRSHAQPVHGPAGKCCGCGIYLCFRLL